jgi:hypothetical protein
MDTPEETTAKNKKVIENEYLTSPKKFYLEMPLYLINYIKDDAQAEVVYKLESYGGTIDAYCIWCEKESVFDTHEYVIDEFGTWRYRNGGFKRHRLTCTRNEDHSYYIYFLKTNLALIKIGQFPSVADFQIPQSELYRKVLGESQYKELTRAIGLKANGVGIGSFVYLRRIFENLIEEAFDLAKASPEFSEESYMKGRMNEKIKLLEGYLPEFLVDNKDIYSILSDGIHNLSEDECLKYFDAIKIGIEQILDEKIEKAAKIQKSKSAKDSIQKVHQELSKTT